jgi:hypothetical protein
MSQIGILHAVGVAAVLMAAMPAPAQERQQPTSPPGATQTAPPQGTKAPGETMRQSGSSSEKGQVTAAECARLQEQQKQGTKLSPSLQRQLQACNQMNVPSGTPAAPR